MSFIRRSTMLAVVAALAFGLSACEEPVQKPDKAATVLSRDVAADVANPDLVHNLLEPLLELLSSPTSLTGPLGSMSRATALDVDIPLVGVGPARPAAAARLAAATEDCITQRPRVPVDGDGDGIPLSLTTNLINCHDASGSSLTGTVVVKDKDDTDPDSGFSVDIDVRIEAPDDVSGRIDFDFAVDVTKRSSSGTLAYDISYAGNFSAEIPEVTLKFSYDMDVKYEGTSFAAGVISLDGSFGYSWDIDCSKAESADECRSRVQSIGSKGAIQLFIKASRLEYTERCATAITRGTVEMRDRTGNVATIRYTGCGRATVTYNGEPL